MMLFTCTPLHLQTQTNYGDFTDISLDFLARIKKKFNVDMCVIFGKSFCHILLQMG